MARQRCRFRLRGVSRLSNGLGRVVSVFRFRTDVSRRLGITRTGIGQYTIKLDTAYAAEALDATVSPEAEAITVVAGLVDKTKLRVGHWLHSGATDTITVCITDALGALADAHFSLVARAW